MPNIHIHTDDPDLVGTIVAYCMSIDHGRLSVSVDNYDHDDLTHVMRRASAETGRRLIESIRQADQDEAARRFEFRQARAAEDEATYDRNVAVACPKCSAAPTMECRTGSGKVYARPFVHVERRRVAFEASVADHPSTPTARAALRWGNYCRCGHDQDIHHKMGCITEGCTCVEFVDASKLQTTITLDEV